MIIIILRIRYMGCYSPPPKINLVSRFERRKGHKGTANNQTFPHYGTSKSGWRERRKSSLSHGASSTVWLLHWILTNLIVLHLVT
jgi:hypothetical protein